MKCELEISKDIHISPCRPWCLSQLYYWDIIHIHTSLQVHMQGHSFLYPHVTPKYTMVVTNTYIHVYTIYGKWVTEHASLIYVWQTSLHDLCEAGVLQSLTLYMWLNLTATYQLIVLALFLRAIYSWKFHSSLTICLYSALTLVWSTPLVIHGLQNTWTMSTTSSHESSIQVWRCTQHWLWYDSVGHIWFAEHMNNVYYILWPYI